MTSNETTQVHWHAGHNVAGYLPESDEPNAYATWHDAMASLCCATLIMRMSATLILGMSWLWKTPPDASGGAG